MTDKLIIFDTTLRDGEQSPGASMTRDEKLRIARQLERLKVDVIEAGFAASSNGDFECVQAIARAIKDSTVCSLARANDRDIARAAEALKDSGNARIHLFIATSPLHMEKKLRMTPDEVFEQAKLAVRFARNLMSDIEKTFQDMAARLVEAFKADRQPLLLVDEAQNMSRDMLRLVHYLLNFETTTTKLLQVVVAGQQELAGRILRFPELASRMFPIALSGMSPSDLSAMIEYRWMVAGGKELPFDQAACDVIFAYSKGLPRDAVKLCDECLRYMMAKNTHSITPLAVESVAAGLNLTA